MGDESLKNRNEVLIGYLVKIWIERKKVVFITSLITLISVLYAILTPAWYTASVKILPSSSYEDLKLREFSSIAAIANVNLSLGETSYHYFYPNIIKSNFILDRVLENKYKTKFFGDSVTLFQIWQNKIDSTENNWQFKIYEEAKQKLRDITIKTDLDSYTELFTVSVTVKKDPVLAKELVNFIIEQLDIYNKTVRKNKAKEQRLFIENSIEGYDKELRIAEDDLIHFEINNKEITSPEKKIIHETLIDKVNLYRVLLTELRKKLELVKIEEIKQTPTLDIIENAIEPFKKTKPRRLLIIIFGFILGIFSSVSYTIIFKTLLNKKNDIINSIKNAAK